MKVKDLLILINATVYNKELYNPEKNINYAFGADLMSDALMILRTVEDTEVLETSVLLTGLTTNQSIRTAEMLDLETVILVRGKIPSQKVIDQANESEILLLGTNHTMFVASGIMYTNGITGVIQ